MQVEEVQALFEQYLPQVHFSGEALITPSGECVEVFLDAQVFVDYFMVFWELYEEWLQRGKVGLQMDYWTEDMEEIEFELTGWKVAEVYGYLEENVPAGVLMRRDLSEPLNASDQPPHVRLLFHPHE